MMRRAKVLLVIRSSRLSGRAASPTAPIASRRTMRSGRTGGVPCGSDDEGRVMSAMSGLRGELRLDLVREQEIVDALVQLLELRRAEIREAEVVGVELGLDAAGMRREHENAAADQQRFFNGVRDEQHGEAHVLPQRDELLLHLAPGQRVERG